MPLSPRKVKCMKCYEGLEEAVTPGAGEEVTLCWPLKYKGEFALGRGRRGRDIAGAGTHCRDSGYISNSTDKVPVPVELVRCQPAWDGAHASARKLNGHILMSFWACWDGPLSQDS